MFAKSETVISGLIRVHLHCNWQLVRLLLRRTRQVHRMVTLHSEPELLVGAKLSRPAKLLCIGCDCGKVFWTMPTVKPDKAKVDSNEPPFPPLSLGGCCG